MHKRSWKIFLNGFNFGRPIHSSFWWLNLRKTKKTVDICDVRYTNREYFPDWDRLGYKSSQALFSFGKMPGIPKMAQLCVITCHMTSCDWWKCVLTWCTDYFTSHNLPRGELWHKIVPFFMVLTQLFDSS